ncbi:MAG: WD40/YVTN/BNR-like repeat-containing protein, partial [Planctomycetota bacterium]
MRRTLPFVLMAGTLITAPLTGQIDRPASTTRYEPSRFEALQYRMVGPTQGGRVTAVAGHRAHPGTFYLGATGGGIWKTTDYGQTWANVSDGYFETPSIGAIRVADSDRNVVWVGTGSDGIRSNVITGRGVYRSSDAGATWQLVGLREAGQIGAVLVHPRNPDVAYVAALGHPFGRNPDRGVYRTTDGGQTWAHVLFLSDSTGAIDLEFAPDDPRQIYAAMWRGERKPWTIISGAREGGIYRSTDGGDTWTKLGGGLPTGLIGKSDLAVSPADPGRLYVLIEAEPGSGLYRSDDRGASFHLVSDQRGLLDRPFYYTNVDADPTNADVVYVNSTRFYRSTDGGATFRRLQTPHGDNHDMWINADDPRLFIQANDGGANVTTNGGETWSSQMNQPTAELYQVNVDDQYPYWLYAGQQDDGTVAVPSLPPYQAVVGAAGWWIAVGGCETGPAVPKPGDHNIVFANCKGRFGRFDKRTGQEQQFYVGAQNLYGHNPKDLNYRFQRVSPIEVSPHDANVVYHASQYVHVTRDGGVTWETISPDLTAFEPDKQVASGQPITRDITGEEHYSAIYAVRESPRERGLIWVGSNDGLVHVTRDGGETWADVTPPGLPPNGRVQHIEPSPHRPGKAYVAVYRYLLDDWSPYFYRTTDYGQSWTLLTTGTNGIPADYPTRV